MPQNCENISEFAPAFKSPVCRLAYFRGEAQAQQIQVIQFARAVAQTNHVARATPARAQCVNRVLYTLSCEVPQKGISRP